MKRLPLFEKILDAQYRRPTGWLGEMIGRRMARNHHPENLWTVSILQAKPTDHILELGFGAGVAIQALSRVVTQGRITGIDFSRQMVVAARRRNARAVRGGRVDLRYGDAAHLPFASAEFDRAFSIHSVYFWPNPLEVLSGVLRVLKPGGILVLTVLPKERWPGASPGTPECIPYSGDELTRLLEQAGFSAVRIAADANPACRSNYSLIGTKP